VAKELKHGRRLKEDKSFNKVCLHRIFSVSISHLPSGIGRTSITGEFHLWLLRERRNVFRVFFLASAVLQVPVAQNNPYAKVTNLGVACSATLNLQMRSRRAF
jgi:hypothetical protein